MTWSSKQRINREDLVSLQKDLLALYIKVSKEDSNIMDIMTNTTYADLIQTGIIDDMQKSILINHEKD